MLNVFGEIALETDFVKVYQLFKGNYRDSGFARMTTWSVCLYSNLKIAVRHAKKPVSTQKVEADFCSCVYWIVSVNVTGVAEMVPLVASVPDTVTV